MNQSTESYQDQNQDQDGPKKGRIFHINDRTYKILCQADRKNFDPTVGLENLCAMFENLAGPIDFTELELNRARQKAREMQLF